ncbi:MAG TPA: hypothetical protein VEC39_11160 [Vicinamibacterales bacterium]|nr:hypothetical protein [Vicinamibacterales bacterium]
MPLKPVAACCAMVLAAAAAAASSGSLSSVTVVIDDGRSLSAAERERVDRALEVAQRRYDEWLGTSTTELAAPIRVRRPWWSSPASMALESQVAFALAQARLSHLRNADDWVEGIAWHLQSRVVEELFDYAQHQPGHHADTVRLFGGHVHWELPILALPRGAHDDRAPHDVQHRAAVIATLEGVVGWPALAGALRVVATDSRPAIDADALRTTLESALGIPLDWVTAAMRPDFSVNYTLTEVATRTDQCDGQPCHETTWTISRKGPPLFTQFADGIPIVLEFGPELRSTVWWRDNESNRQFTVRSGVAPTTVTLDPERRVRLDGNAIDQQWRADGGTRTRPMRSLTAWLVWLQHAVLTYGVLL